MRRAAGARRGPLSQSFASLFPGSAVRRIREPFIADKRETLDPAPFHGREQFVEILIARAAVGAKLEHRIVTDREEGVEAPGQLRGGQRSAVPENAATGLEVDAVHLGLVEGR